MLADHLTTQHTIIDGIHTWDPERTLLAITLARREKAAENATKDLLALLGGENAVANVQYGDGILTRENPAAGLTIAVTGKTEGVSFNFNFAGNCINFSVASEDGTDATQLTSKLLQNIATALKMPFTHTPIVHPNKIKLYLEMGYRAAIGSGYLTVTQELNGYRPMEKKYEPVQEILPA